MRSVARTLDSLGLLVGFLAFFIQAADKNLVEDSAGEGFIVLANAIIRHSVDPSNVFIEVLRYW
jgi:hypothetical protein